jgi:hypothetical protein
MVDTNIRFGFFELDTADAEAIWALVAHQSRWATSDNLKRVTDAATGGIARGIQVTDPLAKRQNVRSIQDTTADTAADASTRVSGQLSIMDSVVVPAATAHVGRRTRRHTLRGPS